MNGSAELVRKGSGAGRRTVLAGGAALGLAAMLAPVATRGETPLAAPSYIPGGPIPDLPPKDVTGPSAMARLDGVDLWYWDTGGTGPAVVFLHPATGSAHVWGYQQQAFADAGYRAIGYSRRGFRGSTGGDPADPGTGADDLAMLADHLGLEHFHLVGTAAGGFVAAAFAIAAPERVRSLTIACSIVSVADPAMRTVVPWVYDASWNDLPHDLRELGPSYRSVNPAGHARWNELHDLSHDGSKALNQPAGKVAATLETLRGIAVPTLLISGDADLIAPPPVARILQRTISGSALTILTECGHSAYWERPNEFNAAVLDFLARHA